MMKSVQMEQQQSSSSDSDGIDQARGHSIIVPGNLIATTYGFEKKEHSWFALSPIPSDLSIQVEDITFCVHKYPLVARCGYLNRLELEPSNPDLGYDPKLENFPGGSETFELVLKFCYDLPIGLNPNNVAALRCASEFLEMTESLEDGNLISKTEAFFTFVVLSSWRDSVTVLKSCEKLSPWAENLQIVRRCCDSISWKVSRENSATVENISEEDWWFEDVVTLRIDHFIRIIVAIRAKGTKPESIGSCIMRYAEKWLPDIDAGKAIKRHGYSQNEVQWSVTTGKSLEGVIGQNKEHRMIIESLVSILPPQKEAVSCKFLLWILKMALVFSISPALISELEKRVGMVLEKANVNDLLIPTYTVGDQGKMVKMINDRAMHNIDVVQRILEYFLIYEQQQQLLLQQNPRTLTVGKLLDNYLAEVARDPNLSISKFQVLAESLPENARTCDDGLYRAIDTYLKTHTSLSEQDRRRLCKIMNCEKLSIDACMHAAQNDRLPLRTVIQVLFSEQVKMRDIIQGKDNCDDNPGQDGSWLCTKKEVNTLKAELEIVKAKMAELQTDYFELQQEYEKLNNKHKSLSSWTFKWMKIKKPSLAQAKIVEEEADDGQPRSHSGHKTKFHRRVSIS
ncbi:unnamed protein product [Coffea canephora]|uniref:NPH3 domain-containing protein n=1 Tax=Coffea canephora TaxID=49390 RepID=A0A068TYS4_COFCA|nr:unnamed protein product [Coffea canephora]